MIKDEYFNINDCNNLSLDFGEISNLTHEYYEYEQGQADIIVKSRLSRIKRFLLLLDTDTINGLTTMGLLSHSSIRPLISKSCSMLYLY
jgi:hypothetical protein